MEINTFLPSGVAFVCVGQRAIIKEVGWLPGFAMASASQHGYVDVKESADMLDGAWLVNTVPHAQTESIDQYYQ